MKKKLCVIVCLLMLLCLMLTGALGTETEARGFDTPEACAKAAVEALSKGDVEAFLDCFAIKEMARKFNLAVFYEKINYFAYGNTLLEPSDPFSIAFNESKLSQDLLVSLNKEARLLDIPDMESLLDSRPLSPKEYSAEQIVELMTLGDVLSKLNYTGIFPPIAVPEILARHSGAHLMKAAEKSAWRLETYGVQGSNEQVVLLDMNGQGIFMPLCFVRYDGGWLISPIRSDISYFLGDGKRMLLVPRDLKR
jgi:hypothetical protein